MNELSKSSILNFQRHIIAWQPLHGRNDLPWQFTDPYTTWVSEIMLQQTQVKTVLPYFKAFMKRFPSVESLALGSLDDVLSLWSGLGYYRRAHRLHEAAKLWVENYPNHTPKNIDQWMSLPGVGRSTAGAILSLSQSLPYPICDGNVKRVLSRYFADTFSSLHENKRWEFLQSLTPKEHARDYNQGLMDIGAMLCTKQLPQCHSCPLTETCAKDFSLDAPQAIKKTKKLTLVLHCHYQSESESIALIRRDNDSIWPSLWFLPIIDHKDKADYIYHQELTHRHLIIHVHLAGDDLYHTDNFTWISLQNIGNIPRPVALDLIIRHMTDMHQN